MRVVDQKPGYKLECPDINSYTLPHTQILNCEHASVLGIVCVVLECGCLTVEYWWCSHYPIVRRGL